MVGPYSCQRTNLGATLYARLQKLKTQLHGTILLKMRIIDKAKLGSSPKQRKLKN